ncbi:uncharacterized protein BDR25DRAFT_18236 [Lindgomyces ingoldianus]|uniref:Uncharacterized protein n=1 Tax=Lindgomyces ingoldianus TaxID=673940 RepID=A0ACB6QYW4_9PLEO|nr:uncharacterized protein BDR25DRAFT_18236 [Lindgomyces ingoldianus]KAF2472091.1 hypothetical protein BDR25DRAFT_18236 [Lindgomyces ingoldianus]
MPPSRAYVPRAIRGAFTASHGKPPLAISNSPLSSLSFSLLRCSSSGAASNLAESENKSMKVATKDLKEGEAPKNKPLAELDKELELKMKGLAGDGGEAGVELEDGQPVALKRGVRNNMFRYI